MTNSPNIPPHPFLPDPNSEAGKKRAVALRELKYSMGELILIFPGVEIVLFSLLGCLWPAPLSVAKALYGDMRINDASNVIKRLLEARKQQFGNNPLEAGLSKWITYVLNQLGIINGVRNHLVHHGFPNLIDVENPIASNTMRARSDPKEIPLAKKDIDAMTADIQTCIGMLSVIGMAAMHPHRAESGFALLEQQTKANPWRYKSPLQGGSAGKSQKKPPEPQPPPQSSPA